MNKTIKTILLFSAFALFLVIAAYAYNTLSKNVSPQTNMNITSDEAEEPQNSPNNEEKTKAPDFTVSDMDGNSVKLSDLIGKPIVLNFWASWCPPCKSEMPEFNQVYKELGKEVTFMMVDLVDGQRETKKTGTEYITEQGFSFPVYFDTTGEAANTYGIMSIPTTIFIDKDGYIVTEGQGAMDEKTLRKGIDLIK